MASHFALFVDLENCGGKKSMLMDVIERVKIRGDILIGKVYGYTDSYSDLKEILLSNTFAVVPSLRFGRNQKNSLDIQLVIDALDVAYTNSLIDSFCIVSGDSDYVPLVGKLKTMGKFVLGISRSEAASGVFMNACSEFQFLESVASGKERAQGQEIEALTAFGRKRPDCDDPERERQRRNAGQRGEERSASFKAEFLRKERRFFDLWQADCPAFPAVWRVYGGKRTIQRDCFAQSAAHARWGADHAGELRAYLCAHSVGIQGGRL